MRPVDDVLGQVLDMDAHPIGVGSPRRPTRLVRPVADHLVAGAERRRHGARRRCGRCARRRATPGPGPWRPIESRHLDEPAAAVEPPTVERTGDPVPAHATTDAQVGPQVGAVRIEDPGHPVLAAEEDEVASEVATPAARRPTARSAPAPTLNQPLGDAREWVPRAHGSTRPTVRLPAPRRGTDRRRHEAEDRHWSAVPAWPHTPSRIAFSAGIPVMVMPTEAKYSGVQAPCGMPVAGKIMWRLTIVGSPSMVVM